MQFVQCSWRRFWLPYGFLKVCGWRDSNPHAEAPDPKSGVSTNFTTPASFKGRKGRSFFSQVKPCVAFVNPVAFSAFADHLFAL